MCVMLVVGAAACQCFAFGSMWCPSHRRISSLVRLSRCIRPQHAVMIRVCPVNAYARPCAPGSKVTVAPAMNVRLVERRGSSFVAYLQWFATEWKGAMTSSSVALTLPP